MKKVEISRSTAEITIDEIKMVFSNSTGFLDSIITVPFKFEWVGKSELSTTVKIENDDLFKNIIDVHFIEVFDEDSTGILLTIIGENARLNVKFSIIADLPVIFIESKLLLTEFPKGCTICYYPIQFNLNKIIQPSQINVKTFNNYHYLGMENQFGLIFYVEIPSEINVYETKKVCIRSQLSLELSKPGEINLPFSYISSVSKEKLHLVDSLHPKIIQKYQNHLKKLKEKYLYE